MDDRQDQNGKMLLLPFTSFLLSKDFSVRGEKTSDSLRKDGRGQHEIIHHPPGFYFILFYFLGCSFFF
jgi:hypothetical protein